MITFLKKGENGNAAGIIPRGHGSRMFIFEDEYFLLGKHFRYFLSSGGLKNRGERSHKPYGGTEKIKEAF